MKSFKDMTPEDFAEMQFKLAEIEAEKAQLLAENTAYKVQEETGVKSVAGAFKAKLKEAGSVVEKTFGFALGSPIFFRTTKGDIVHAESMMKIANGETVTAESILPLADAANAAEEGLVATKLAKCAAEIGQYNQVTAQAELQRLAEIGYTYLVGIKK